MSMSTSRRVKPSTWINWLWRLLNRPASPIRARLPTVRSQEAKARGSKKGTRHDTTCRSTSRSTCRAVRMLVAKKEVKRCAMAKCSYSSWNLWTKAFWGVTRTRRMINRTIRGVQPTTVAARCCRRCLHRCRRFLRCTTCKTFRVSRETTLINSLIIMAMRIAILWPQI